MQFMLAKLPYKKLIKFCLVGGVGFLIQGGTLLFFTEVFGLWYILSFVIGVILATIWTFTVNLKWTFKGKV